MNFQQLHNVDGSTLTFIFDQKSYRFLLPINNNNNKKKKLKENDE
jgi:hypothetical protein